MSTASNIRPTILDYHFAYSNGGYAIVFCSTAVSVLPILEEACLYFILKPLTFSYTLCDLFGQHLNYHTSDESASGAGTPFRYLSEHTDCPAGMVTPNDMAERLTSFLKQGNSKHHWLSQWSADNIKQQAAAATERYAAGKSLSVFDGVPFCVKDSLDALPYETRYGTNYMGKT